MQKKLLISIFILASVLLSQFLKDSPKDAPRDPDDPSLTTVNTVIDGDTVKVTLEGKDETLRLIGIDTPETDGRLNPVECYGKEATEATRALLLNKEVSLASDATQSERDTYGRLLAYLTLKDGTDVGEYLILNGFAKEYTYAKPYKNQTRYQQAEAGAKQENLGLWSESNCPNTTL